MNERLAHRVTAGEYVPVMIEAWSRSIVLGETLSGDDILDLVNSIPEFTRAECWLKFSCYRNGPKLEAIFWAIV